MPGTNSGLRKDLLTEAECPVHCSSGVGGGGGFLRSEKGSAQRNNVRRQLAQRAHFYTRELRAEKAKELWIGSPFTPFLLLPSPDWTFPS